MPYEHLTHLIKSMDRLWLQAGVPMPGYIFQSGWKGIVEGSFNCPMDEHQGLKTLQMIYGISNPIVAFKLWHLEILGERLLYNLIAKWQVGIILVITHRCLVVDRFDLLVHLPEPVIDVCISDDIVFRTLQGDHRLDIESCLERGLDDCRLLASGLQGRL